MLVLFMSHWYTSPYVSKNVSVTVTSSRKGIVRRVLQRGAFNTKVMERTDKDIIIDYLPKELGTENFSIH
ncbi:hypothetical protein ABE15_03175 [Bacillus cereus]|nr:hypothetical protein [Bacillus cereus]